MNVLLAALTNRTHLAKLARRQALRERLRFALKSNV